MGIFSRLKELSEKGLNLKAIQKGGCCDDDRLSQLKNEAEQITNKKVEQK